MVFAADDCCVGIAPVEHVVLSVSYGICGAAARRVCDPIGAGHNLQSGLIRPTTRQVLPLNTWGIRRNVNAFPG